jgi:hypothetical protein
MLVYLSSSVGHRCPANFGAIRMISAGWRRCRCGSTTAGMGWLLVLAVLLAPAFADDPVVVAAEATRAADGSWRFDVTVRHADAGWQHHADRWQVTAPDGMVLGERVLLHPHVNEQPFTRSLDGVAVPDGVAEVGIRAHDTVHGWGPALAIRLAP